MFSKELENLIQATLEDGILEDYEKAALVKRAQIEGVDLAELEIYINSILQKRNRELENEKKAKREQAEKEKKEAFGRRCPNCGAQVPPLTLKCECGYEFTNSNNGSSIQLLLNKIDSILESPLRSSDKLLSASSSDDLITQYILAREKDFYNRDLKQRDQRIKDAIAMFPVPNTKEDIVEFLTLALPNTKKKGGLWGSRIGRIFITFCIIASIALMIAIVLELLDPDAVYLFIFLDAFICFGLFVTISINISNNYSSDMLRHNDFTSVWKRKFNQVLMKGRSLRGDFEFQKQLDYYENLLKK